jgi:hypothetical protein
MVAYPYNRYKKGGTTMAKEKERQLKVLSDYGIIYLSGIINEAKAESV